MGCGGFFVAEGGTGVAKLLLVFTVLALENDLPCRDIGRADVGREVDGVLLLKDLLRDLVGDCKLLLGVLGGDGLES